MGNMGAKVQVHVRGGAETHGYVKAAYQLRDELESAGIEFEDYRSYGLELVGIIFITIIGSVASHYVIKLIDSLVQTKKQNPGDGVRITFVDASVNIRFQLPEEHQEAIKHFEDKGKTEDVG